MHGLCAVDAKYVSRCRLRIPYLDPRIDLSKKEHIYSDRRRVYRTERRTWLRKMRNNRVNKYIVVMVVLNAYAYWGIGFVYGQDCLWRPIRVLP